MTESLKKNNRTNIISIQPIRSGMAVLKSVFGDTSHIVYFDELQLGHSRRTQEINLEEWFMWA